MLALTGACVDDAIGLVCLGCTRLQLRRAELLPGPALWLLLTSGFGSEKCWGRTGRGSMPFGSDGKFVFVSGKRS